MNYRKIWKNRKIRKIRRLRMLRKIRIVWSFCNSWALLVI